MLDVETTPSHYPVEVSGWDADHNFFVERTTLEWSESCGRTVLIRRNVPYGALLFVRLAGPLQTAFPLPYRVRSVQVRGARGLHRVNLEQMRTEGSVGDEEVFSRPAEA